MVLVVLQLLRMYSLQLLSLLLGCWYVLQLLRVFACCCWIGAVYLHVLALCCCLHIERVISLLSASPVGEARCRCRKVWLTRIDYHYYYAAVCI
jgi:hypothetical protein